MPPISAGPVPLVEVRRGDRLECIHYGSIAVCDTDGNLIYSRGAPEQPAYLRSSAKPFQAMTAVHLGAADRWGLTDAEIAVVCASHGAQEVHLDAVRSILKKCGLTPEAFQCGPHHPLRKETAEALFLSGKRPTRIHNNCSGKHSGILATCRHKGWPIETYRDPDHPHQVEIRKCLSAFAGISAGELPYGVDGCGVPTFYLSMTKLATAYARLGNAKARPEPYAPPAERVVKAICSHPVHVSYEGSYGAAILQHLGNHLVAKGGAEGVFTVGLIGRNLGIALKIIDGADRAIPHVMAKLLEQFLHEVSVEALREETLQPILNTRDEPVGDMRVIGL